MQQQQQEYISNKPVSRARLFIFAAIVLASLAVVAVVVAVPLCLTTGKCLVTRPSSASSTSAAGQCHALS